MGCLLGERILKLSIPAKDEVEITLTNGKTYRANLRKKFDKVYCYPQTESEWMEAFIGEDEIDIQWPGGFAVHLDQVVPLSF